MTIPAFLLAFSRPFVTILIVEFEIFIDGHDVFTSLEHLQRICASLEMRENDR
jgi:hypothetical protein